MKKEEILAKLAAGDLQVDEASKLLAELDQKRAAYESAVAFYTGDLLPEPLFDDVSWLYNLRLACREDMISMRTFLAERRPQHGLLPRSPDHECVRRGNCCESAGRPESDRGI